jgi:hypothetical protein
MAMAVIAGVSFAVLAAGTLAVGWRLHVRAQAAEAAGIASSFPAPAIAQPTLATPLFDEIPSASAASAPPSPPAATVAAPPSDPAASSTAAAAGSPAPTASSAADTPKGGDAKTHPRPARTAQPAASAPTPKRHLPGSGL